MASATRWTWVWVNSGSWWWTGRPGILQSTRTQRIRHDWATELNWKSQQMVTAAMILKMLTPWEKSSDRPRQHIKKKRHYFANKDPSIQGYVFSSSHVWIWELDYKESWVPKNWCFELWCWRRLWRVPLTARRSSQSILKEVSLEYSLEGMMLKLKLRTLATWYKELTHWKRPWCWEILRAGGAGGDRGWDGWMASLTWWAWVWVGSRSWWWIGKPGV